MITPTPNNKINAWREKRNHVRIPKKAESKKWLDAYYTGQNDTPAPPVNVSIPVISGTPSVGSTLTCSTGVWTGNPVPTYAYLWRRDGIAISGGTLSTYVATEADVGANLYVDVTATNTEGSAVAYTTAFGPITPAPAAPVNTVAPVVSGDPATGQTLTSTTGTWTGYPTPTYTRQWKRDSSLIVGAIQSTYNVDDADIGHMLSCTVLATNASASVSANSNAVGPVTDSQPGSITITTPIINESSTPDEITLTTNSDGRLYWVVTASSTTPTAAQIIAGQAATGAAATLHGDFLVAYGVTTSYPDFSTLAVGAWYLHCVLTADAVNSNTVTSASFDIAASFTPAWQQFSTAWLEKNSDLTGMPTNSAGFIFAMTYSPSAGDIGQQRDLFMALSGTNRLLSLSKSTLNGVDSRIETSSDVQTWVLASSTTAMVSGGKYLILVSCAPSGAGAKARVIRLDTGGNVTLSPNDTDTGTLGGPSALGWAIGAGSGSGLNNTSGQIERIMFWANTYADANDSTVQGYFHEAGVLKDPAVAVAAIGTPHVNIYGNALQVGTNAGSGGNFVKDGAGTITPA